jgi:cyclopropane fatty-acyl-phospholipid synthase-like methyltransferase
MSEESRLQRFKDRYASGTIPWDDDLPPPELIALVDRQMAGRALDLGCGFGRTSIYLARHGWQVDGVDFVPAAIQEARQRAETAGVAQRTQFHIADVSKLDFLKGPYDLAIDIGCMHTFTAAELVSYRDGLYHLLADGATYLLFAHLRDDEDEIDPEEPRWIADEDLLALFAEGFILEHAEYGVTQVEDKPPWRSAWFTYRADHQR